MANKLYNHQTTQKFTGGKSASGHGSPLKTSHGTHQDIMPGLPGKAGSYPAKTGDAEVVSIYPVAEGIDG